MRRLALLPLIPAVLLGVSACNPEHAGAAATIGSHRLDLGDFMDATVQGFAHYTGPTDSSGTSAGKGSQADFQRLLLSRDIAQILISDVAAKLGVSVSDTKIKQETVNADQQAGSHKALLAQEAAQGISPSTLPALVRAFYERQAIAAKLLKDNPVTEQAVQAYYAANSAQFASFHVADILLTDQALAQSTLTATKADPSTFAAQARAHSIDTNTKAAGGDLGQQAAGSLTQQGYPAEVETAILAAKAGDVLGPFTIQGQSSTGVATTYYVLFHVIAVSNKSLAQARSSIVSTLSAPGSTYATGLLSEALNAAAAKAKIHVSSRFGVWDASTATVIASGADPKTALSVLGKTDPAAAPLAATGTGATTQPTP